MVPTAALFLGWQIRKINGAAAIGQAVGAVLGRRHMAKHFHISIADDAFSRTQLEIDGLQRAEGVLHAAETFVGAHRWGA
jgi:hypothetical protein